MLLTRLHRRFTAWVTLLALVLGALAPTVAQALVVGTDRTDWLQVCSASGMVWVKADTGEVRATSPDGGHPPASDARPHCPWCTLHGGDAGGPVQHAQPHLPRSTGAKSPPLHSAPLAAAARASAQPRAPPQAA